MINNSRAIAEFRNVTKSYTLGEKDIFALDQVNYKLYESDFAVIAGPSGSGKSTFLNIMGCLDKPNHGEVFFNLKDITHSTLDQLNHIRLSQMGFIFQSFNLIPVLTAFENVELPLLFKLSDKQMIKDKAKLALEQVGLGDRLYHKPAQLSGGQRQRVAIARAIAGSPLLVVADEPTANLDQKTSQTIINLMKELNESLNMTILVATHDPLIMEYANRVNHIADGILSSN